MKKFKFILLICLGLLLFTSCNENSVVEDKKYSIAFEENGGNVVEDIFDIEKGSTVELPTISRTGYVFEGWYTSKSFIAGTKVTNDTAIAKNIKLYAKWKALSFKINIDLDGGTMDSKYSDGVNNISYGVEMTLPMPKKEGYLFQGWYLNNVLFDGTLTVSEDVNITTKWIDLSTLEEKYQLTLNLNGGALYKYNSKEELMEEFLSDFSTFIRRKTDSTNFWNYSYESIIGFFKNQEYNKKWIFLVDYLSTTAREENRDYLNKLVKGENLNYNDSEMVRTIVRNEILAFFLNTERVVSGWGSMVSGNYAQKELQDGYIKYCQIETPKEYKTGEGILLKEPIKEGYIFLGWYDNDKFEGTTYMEVGTNEYGNKTFYALWGKVE